MPSPFFHLIECQNNLSRWSSNKFAVESCVVKSCCSSSSFIQRDYVHVSATKQVLKTSTTSFVQLNYVSDSHIIDCIFMREK